MISLISLDSIFVKSYKECYSKIFLEGWTNLIKDRKIINTINDDLELSESNESDTEKVIRPFPKNFLLM